MRLKLLLLIVNMAVLAAWLGQFVPSSWPDGHF
jgi:hypothetical protein